MIIIRTSIISAGKVITSREKEIGTAYLCWRNYEYIFWHCSKINTFCEDVNCIISHVEKITRKWYQEDLPTKDRCADITKLETLT